MLACTRSAFSEPKPNQVTVHEPDTVAEEEEDVVVDENVVPALPDV